MVMCWKLMLETKQAPDLQVPLFLEFDSKIKLGDQQSNFRTILKILGFIFLNSGIISRCLRILAPSLYDEIFNIDRFLE